MKNAITCNRCQASLASESFNTPEMISCPSCGVALKIEVFPAFFKASISGKIGEVLLGEHEASCFYHQEKKAVVPCDSCGRFLCALCDIELNDHHLCPACLETDTKRGRLEHLDTHRVLYDAIALRLSIYPMLLFFLWFFSIITAPISLVIAIRYWNAPSSVTPRRTKLRLSIALILSSLQILGWGIVVWWWIVGI